jgi:hypothetical protein
MLDRSKERVALFKRNGFSPIFMESGHNWINWQKYLNEFVPQLFRWHSVSNENPSMRTTRIAAHSSAFSHTTALDDGRSGKIRFP